MGASVPTGTLTANSLCREMATDMDPEALPAGIMKIKLSAKALAIANAILEAVKDSRVVVTQLLQETVDVPEDIMNGVLSTKDIALGGQYADVQRFERSRESNRALYMHNKSLIEVAGADLVHKLYKAVKPLKQDVLVNYPLLYISDNPKSSNDVLIGSTDSWSPLHQDLPLYCTSAILVLEGHKEFVVVHDEVAASLRVNLSSGCWDQPATHQGQTYPDLQSLVHATGGAVLSLRAGDLMLMPPRVFHLARNCAPTVSCNFSICTMDNVPVTLAQTLLRIEQCPRDVMHFDSDFAQLLVDCTKALIQQVHVRGSSISNMTSRGKLPAVKSILNSSNRLWDWYMVLQSVPNGWVEGFWGDVRHRLLDQLLAALPLHNRSPGPAAGPDKGAAAGPLAAAAAAAAVPSSVPRPLSTGRAMGTKGQLKGSRRATRSDTAAAAAAAAAVAAEAPRVKRPKLDDGPSAATATVV